MQDTATTRTLYVRHSSATSATSWGAAFTPSLQGTTNLDLDDISAIVAFKGKDGVGKIGVMWSNQNDGTMHFGVHKDADADSQWIDQPAITGLNLADDHLALRALNADSSGEVVAVFKTSLNDVNPSTSTEPLIYLGVRQSTGAWKKTV